MKISVFGAGYVGLVTSTCFAELGNEVVCCDVDEKKIKRLQAGDVPIYEPGLDVLIGRNMSDRRLSFTVDKKAAVEFGSFIFIAVGTPDKNGEVDLRYVDSVAKDIGSHLNCDGKIIVDKSTVPVDTALRVMGIINVELQKRQKSFKFGVASNPEFLREGSAIEDFMRPDRIVVGSNMEWVHYEMAELYTPVTKNGHPIVLTNFASAEVSKYASNTFLANRISQMNEISAICEATGADIEDVRRIVASDRRIGDKFLYPGVGYGGSCFPKDVVGLIATAKKYGCSAHIATAVHRTNQEQRTRFVDKIINNLISEFASPLLTERKVSIWGLSFKPLTDDMREAPSVDIIKRLIAEGVHVNVYDPVAMDEARKVFGSQVIYSTDMYKCLEKSNALITVTEWSQFKTPDFEKIKKMLSKPLIFDGRNIYSLEQIKKFGFTYFSVGRAIVRSKKGDGL